MPFNKTPIGTGPFLSSRVQTNFEDLNKYLGGGMVAADLKTSSTWVDAKHLMKPEYHSVSNTMEFVSGFQGGKFRTAPKDLMTMVTKYNTARQDASITNVEDAMFNYIGNTAIEMRIPRNVRFILLQYTISPQSPYFDVHSTIGGEQQTEVNLVVTKDDDLILDDLNEDTPVKRKVVSGSYCYVEDSQPTAQRSFNISRKPMSGFFLLTNQAASIYKIALCGRSDCMYTRFINWTLSAEAWI